MLRLETLCFPQSYLILSLAYFFMKRSAIERMVIFTKLFGTSQRFNRSISRSESNYHALKRWYLKAHHYCCVWWTVNATSLIFWRNCPDDDNWFTKAVPQWFDVHGSTTWIYWYLTYWLRDDRECGTGSWHIFLRLCQSSCQTILRPKKVELYHIRSDIWAVGHSNGSIW
jgi:hypothetical protein